MICNACNACNGVFEVQNIEGLFFRFSFCYKNVPKIAIVSQNRRMISWWSGQDFVSLCSERNADGVSPFNDNSLIVMCSPFRGAVFRAKKRRKKGFVFSHITHWYLRDISSIFQRYGTDTDMHHQGSTEACERIERTGRADDTPITWRISQTTPTDNQR